MQLQLQFCIHGFFNTFVIVIIITPNVMRRKLYIRYNSISKFQIGATDLLLNKDTSKDDSVLGMGDQDSFGPDGLNRQTQSTIVPNLNGQK